MGIPRTRGGVEDAAAIPLRIVFDPQARSFDIAVGVGACVEVLESQPRYGKGHPIAEAQTTSDDGCEQAVVRLLPEAFERPSVASWVYSGDDVHPMGHEAWTVEQAAGLADLAGGGGKVGR